MRFLELKCINFEYDFLEICSQLSNQQYSSIWSDNGMAPVRRQAIIWNNDGLAYWRIDASSGLNELVHISASSSSKTNLEITETPQHQIGVLHANGYQRKYPNT